MPADPAPGTPLRVLTSELNASSTFWSRYQGFAAHLIQVDPDGLWTIAVEEPATTGWLSSFTGNIITDPEPPVVPPPADPKQAVEVWTKVDLPARYNPVPAVKPARLQIMGLPPMVPLGNDRWWRRAYRWFTTGKE